MIGLMLTADHYVRHPDYQALLAGCWRQPRDTVGPLVMADWLDEWSGGPSYPPRMARNHADFIRAQVSAVSEGGSGSVRTVKGQFGSGAVHAQKVWFADTLQREPWLAQFGNRPASAVVNSTGCGIYYRNGLPFAVKCHAADVSQHAPALALWQVPNVYVRFGPNGFGVTVRTERGERHEEFGWLRAPVPFGVDRWVNRAEVPDGRREQSYLVETVLTRAYGSEMPRTRFHAVHRTFWKCCRPLD